MKFPALVIAALLDICVYSQNWEKMHDFPGAKRDDAVGFSIGEYGFVGTGRDEGFAYRNDFWKYNYKTDSWMQIAVLPGSPRQYSAAFVIGNKGYVFGGLLNDEGLCSKELWEYDLIKEDWTRMADLPGEARQSCVAFAFGGYGYISTGRNNKTEYLKDTWQYNPANNSWIQIADFPGTPRHEANVMQWEHMVCIGLGKDSGDFPRDMYVFNCIDQQWKTSKNFPYHGLFYSQGFSLHGQGYCSTGEDHKQQYQNNTYQYNFLLDNWAISTDLPGIERRGTASFNIGNSQYFVGGLTKLKQRTGEVWRFSTTSNSSYRVYPNPAIDKLVVEVNTTQNQMTLYDVSGRKIDDFLFEGNQFLLNLLGYESGLYLYLLNNQFMGKFLVR